MLSWMGVKSLTMVMIGTDYISRCESYMILAIVDPIKQK
jgi:hypothetical protein